MYTYAIVYDNSGALQMKEEKLETTHKKLCSPLEGRLLSSTSSSSWGALIWKETSLARAYLYLYLTSSTYFYLPTYLGTYLTTYVNVNREIATPTHSLLLVDYSGTTAQIYLGTFLLCCLLRFISQNSHPTPRGATAMLAAAGCWKRVVSIQEEEVPLQ